MAAFKVTSSNMQICMRDWHILLRKAGTCSGKPTLQEHIRERFRRTVNLHDFAHTTWPEPPVNHLTRRQSFILARASAQFVIATTFA